jgi:hypothetical protein
MNMDGTQTNSYIIHSHGSECDEKDSSGLHVYHVYSLIYMPDQVPVSIHITGGVFTFYW